MYTGTEPFTVNNQPTGMTIADYWRWSSNPHDRSFRSSLAQFIVSASLDAAEGRKCDVITKDGLRIVVKTTSYNHSADPDSPDHVRFDLEPFDTVSDIHVFCVCKTLIADEDPINLDLWDFYVVPTAVVDDELLWQKSITLPKLTDLHPYFCDYYGLPDAVKLVTDND